MPKLSQKTALVTGGSRGIGAAIARKLAAEGANVALTYSSSEAKAQQVTTECRGLGVQAEAICANAADIDVMKGLVDRVVDGFGQLDILVNNAAIFSVAPLEECSDEDFQNIIDINIRAVFLTARAAAKIMPSGGRIINIGSGSAHSIRFPNESLYTMSKCAVVGFTRAWARDLGTKGITVNCVQPGPIATDMTPEEGDIADIYRDITGLKRYGKPEEVAQLVAFLASDDSSYITGACLNIDGGYGT
ncbi:MAG: 3-oxoacyl-ACP reductase FabG [Hormoscilla sp. GM7CHS1pb]|nr:3-oxoacyl-ACP reductase FabG [Hormoscilla sp. GM7CHS1pb]